jgi:heterotetrameric sarcosine oxidase delta subunit
MQLFHCPFCGPRVESEFHYGGEAPNRRPEKDAPVSDEIWADYLYMRHNPKGRTHEVWMHRTCGEMFEMTRDTVTHVVEGTRAFGRGEPAQ